MSAVKKVRERTDVQCLVTSCCDSGCSLSMENAPEPYVLISLEHEAAPIDQSKSHCDFLFVGGGENTSAEWVAPVELTISAPTVKKFLPQLQAGASLAEKLIPKSVKVKFRPIAVHGGDIRRIETRRFLKTSNHVEFRCQKIPFKLVRCGSPLTKALRG